MSDHLTRKQAADLPGAASELNNLLQIIAGTVTLLENMWDGDARAAKYFEMLHMSVERASNVTGRLADLGGGTSRKILLHPSYGRLAEAASAPRQPCILVVDDEPMALDTDPAGADPGGDGSGHCAVRNRMS